MPALLAVEDVYAYPKWSARALFEAGRAFEQLKQPDQAKQQYTQLVTKYKDAPEAEMAQDRLKEIEGLEIVEWVRRECVNRRLAVSGGRPVKRRNAPVAYPVSGR